MREMRLAKRITPQYHPTSKQLDGWLVAKRTCGVVLLNQALGRSASV